MSKFVDEVGVSVKAILDSTLMTKVKENHFDASTAASDMSGKKWKNCDWKKKDF